MFAKLLRTILILIITITPPLFSQTDSLNIFWDKNSEPDMYRYRLQRSVNSSGFQTYLTLSHPDTHAVDRNIQPGNLYGYRVAAMDSAGNLSNFSAPESVGIPGINWPVYYLLVGRDTTLDNASFLSDPDGQINSLQLSVSQESQVVVTLQNNGIQISPLNPNYIGLASFVLRAEDSDGFYDLKQIHFSFYDPTLENTSPHLVNLPETVNIEKGDSVTFDLVDFFIDSTHSINDAIWEFEPGPNINYNFNPSIFQLTIVPDTNWVGTSTMAIKVSDPLGLFDEVVMTINVGVGIGPRSIDEVVVYPNPCIYQNGHTEIAFDNIPAGTRKISLFNILGQKVYEQTVQNLNNPYRLRAFDGQPLNLTSGYYIYLFQGAPNGESRTGMFVIVR